MKLIRSLTGLGLCTLVALAPAASPLTPNLPDVLSGRGWKGDTTNLRAAEKDGAPAIRFEKPAAGLPAGIVWLDGLEFTAGTIEFDAKGQSAPVQSNFIGVALRVVDGTTHDVVYFRPFNFRAEDPERKIHAVQYVSHPAWTWQKLRTERNGQFEKSLEPAPDGDAWFHARLVVAKRKISVFVNGATTPSLVVDELSDRPGGSVGLWCQGVGLIANLKITPESRPAGSG
ncbi:MAG: hypothetical protein EXS38_11105 [Opitutus sp.]|nr:hypothetical protein [Opitutus sp.]